MKKFKSLVSTYYIEMFIVISSICMKAYAYSLIGPREGQGLAELLRIVHNLNAYEDVSRVCDIITIIGLIIAIIHYVLLKMVEMAEAEEA